MPAKHKVHAHNAATVQENNMFSPRDSGRAMSRKVRAMREMDANAADLVSPMTEILREEEGRDD